MTTKATQNAQVGGDSDQRLLFRSGLSKSNSLSGSRCIVSAIGGESPLWEIQASGKNVTAKQASVLRRNEESWGMPVKVFTRPTEVTSRIKTDAFDNTVAT